MRRVVITKEIVAFALENEDTMVDKVIQVFHLNSDFFLKIIRRAQIPLSEIENVRDMHSADSDDMQKVLNMPWLF